MLNYLGVDGTSLRRLLIMNSMAQYVREHEITGNPVSFITNLAEPLSGFTIPFLPVQNLNGQSAPYPPGGGKNLVDIAPVKVTSQTTIGGVFSLKAGTYSFSLTAKNNTSIPGAMKITVNGSQVGSSGGIYANTTNRIKIQNVTLDSDSDNVGIVISASTAGYDIDISEVQVEAGSSSTDYAPYSNICPISGWTGLTAYRTGKNLIDDSKRVKNNTNVSVFIGQENTTDYPLFLKAGKYTFSMEFESGYHYAMYYKERNSNQIQIWSTGATDTKKTFTISEDGWYRFWAYKNDGIDETKIGNAWLNYGETASPYTPYVGQSYPVTFPDGGTIYGGTLDAVTGVLSVDRVMVDLGTLNYTKYTPSGSLISNYYAKVEGKQNNTELISSALAFSGNFSSAGMALNGSADNTIAGFSNATSTDKWIYVRMDSCTTASELKTALTGVQLVYELAAPVEIQLDPLSIATMIGDNTIWTDTNGENTIKYKKKG